MIEYYSCDKTRNGYQALLGESQRSQPHVLYGLTQEIIRSKPAHILELGCGSGWILDELMQLGLAPEAYTGAELSLTVIEQNRLRIPKANWYHLTTYETTLPSSSMDIAFSYFVLEHCVYPERHLNELVRVLRPGGRAYVVTPNFINMGILPSQNLGIAEGNTRELITQKKFIAALFAFYDSRFRLRRALRKLSKNHGPFVLNLNPRCLSNPPRLVPDADAVCMTTTEDFHLWANEKQLEVRFPMGHEGYFRSIHFVEFKRPELTCESRS